MIFRNIEIPKTKQELIDKFHSEFPVVGEEVYIKRKCLGYVSKNQDPESFSSEYRFTVSYVDQETGNIKGKAYGYSSQEVSRGNYKRSSYDIGANPFYTGKHIRVTPYTLESILSQLGLLDETHKEKYFLNETNGVGVKNLNWNPFVTDKDGNKHYYQRDFCWGLKDKQMLIESIYNGIDCGKIIIRPRSFKWIENHVKTGEWQDIFWYDIVDGKQRLNAIHEFVWNKFKDNHGNYFKDLSTKAQNAIGDTQLITYAQFDEDVSDQDVIETFIRLNIFGKVVKKTHIDSVMKINDMLK